MMAVLFWLSVTVNITLVAWLVVALHDRDVARWSEEALRVSMTELQAERARAARSVVKPGRNVYVPRLPASDPRGPLH